MFVCFSFGEKAQRVFVELHIDLFTTRVRYLLDWWDLLSSEEFRLKTNKNFGKIATRKDVDRVFVRNNFFSALVPVLSHCASGGMLFLSSRRSG